jgi:hypothetical protein
VLQTDDRVVTGVLTVLLMPYVALGGLMVNSLVIRTSASSYPAVDDGFLRAIKFSGTTAFGT